MTRSALVSELMSLLLALNYVVCAAFTTGHNRAWWLYCYVAEYAITPVQALWLAALVVAPAASAAPRISTRALLLSPPARVLGKLSYAIYCFQAPVFWGLLFIDVGAVSKGAVPNHESPDGSVSGHYLWPVWMMLPIIAIICVVAACAHYLLEAPARKSLNQRQAARAQARQPADPAASDDAYAASARETLVAVDDSSCSPR